VGFLLVLLAMTLFPVLDGVAKYLADDYHVVQLSWARSFFQTLTVVAFISVFVRRPTQVARTSRPGLQVLRGLIMGAMNLLYFLALTYMPLADMVAILFVSPLLVTALCVPLLGESVGPRRWIAVTIGFVGALVIIRPGLGVFQWAALLPLLVAFLYACYQIVTRGLAATDAPLTTLLYTSGVSLVPMVIVAPFFWTPPTLAAWGLFAGVGVFAGLGHFALIKAFDFANASTLAPYIYFQILSGVAMGYLVFGDLPDRWTILGTGVIVASGAYVAYRESRAGGAGA
jgi:drug/metabolite transporter (DMT)-like permease